MRGRGQRYGLIGAGLSSLVLLAGSIRELFMGFVGVSQNHIQ